MVVDRRSTPGEGGVASHEAAALEAEALDAASLEAEALEADALDAEALEPEALAELAELLEPPEHATMNSANIAANTVARRALVITDFFIVSLPSLVPKRNMKRRDPLRRFVTA